MKLKVITILTVIILLVMHVPVYADTTIPEPPSDGYEYWIMVSYTPNKFWFISSPNPITVTTDESKFIVDKSNYYFYRDNQWDLVSQYGFLKTYDIADIIQSNHDIAYEDGSGFFFLRPRVSQLFQTMKITDFGTILRNFSVGLIPIIGSLILVISLAKGWEFLRGQLKS